MDQFVDLVLSVSEISALDVMVILLAPTASGSVKLEGPQEVVALLEDTTNGVNLVNEIFNALDVVSSLQLTLNDEVVCNWNSASTMLKF